MAFVGKRRDAERFKRLIEITRARRPRLLAWLAQRPMQALEFAGEWERLLAVVVKRAD